MRRSKFSWKAAAHSLISVAAVISISVGIISAVSFFTGSEVDLLWTAGGTAIGAWLVSEYDRLKNKEYYNE